MGDAIYGEKYAQAIEATGRAKGTLQNYASVARRVPRSKRRTGLSWSHHEAVAAREFGEQDHWLDRATAEGLNVEEFRELLREERNLTTSVGPDCDEIVEGTASVLRDQLIRECGFPDDITVSIDISGPDVVFTTQLGAA